MGEQLPAATQTGLGIFGDVPWAEATVMLIERDPRIFAYPQIRDYSMLHGREMYGARYFEPLAKYFEQPDTPLQTRLNIIDGCLAYLEKLKIQITNNEAFSFDQSEGEKANANAMARLSFYCLAIRMRKAAPDLMTPRLGPAARELLDHCIAIDYQNRDIFVGVSEGAVALDTRPWDEQKDYWLPLLKQPVVLGIAFSHVSRVDPFNPELDAAIVDLFSRQLRGEERYMGAFFLLKFSEVRNDESVIARILGQIAPELRPLLVTELEKYPFSKPWVELVSRPVLGAPANPPKCES